MAFNHGHTGLLEHNSLGSVGFFSTYRPPLPLDLFSLRPYRATTPVVSDFERRLTDGKSYNYNGRVIPPEALKLMLQRPMLSHVGTENDVDSGDLFGFLLVSERAGGLETIHFSFILKDNRPLVFSFADVYGTYNKVRMEDSPVIAGEYLVYVSTMQPAIARRQPWTAVYRTHLVTGETQRLTPPETTGPNDTVSMADLNPAVSPSGEMIAVASFEGKEGGWQGEIEDLMTNIIVFSMDKPLNRHKIITNGGWPSWGSDNVLYFHRKLSKDGNWAVFKAELKGFILESLIQVTQDDINAFTPAAIDQNKVALCTIRKAPDSSDPRMLVDQYRQIEIFDSTGQHKPIPVTKASDTSTVDHYNPFVINQSDGVHIGYHRAVVLLKKPDEVESHQLMNLNSPIPNLGLFRVSGVFPSFSKNGKKLAFVDNEFLAVYVADDKPLRKVYQADEPNRVWAPVWSQNPTKDILYFCYGPSFSPSKEVDIMAIFDASTDKRSKPFPSVKSSNTNNAFPCTNPDGTRLVFRATELQGANAKAPNKHLYIRDDADKAIPMEKTTVTTLTSGNATYTHCDWSPNGKWIVFSATLDKPADAPESDNNLDPGYYAIYLLAVDNPSVVVRVLQSGPNFAGHVNHPFFSPDGSKIVVASDLAAVSCDPISLPIFIHSVRPYGDIFTIEIDSKNIEKNKDITSYTRMTHSKYENSTCTWTSYSTSTSRGRGGWNLVLSQPHVLRCPFLYPDGRESWQMTGHLCIPHRRC